MSNPSFIWPHTNICQYSFILYVPFVFFSIVSRQPVSLPTQQVWSVHLSSKGICELSLKRIKLCLTISLYGHANKRQLYFTDFLKISLLFCEKKNGNNVFPSCPLCFDFRFWCFNMDQLKYQAN